VPIVTDIPIDCAAVEANPLAYHWHDFATCTRFVRIVLEGVAADHSFRAEQEMGRDLAADIDFQRDGSAMPAPWAARWLRRQILKRSDHEAFGVVHSGSDPQIGIVAELAPAARILSVRQLLDSRRFDRLLWRPSWADDFERWAQLRGWTSKLVADRIITPSHVHDILVYARERGFAAVAFGPRDSYILDLDAIGALYPTFRAPPGFHDLVQDAFDRRNMTLSEAALLSSMLSESRELAKEKGLEWFSPSRAVPWVERAARYLEFLRQASDRLTDAADQRCRAAAALDIILGLKRYLGLVAHAMYAAGMEHARSLELGARAMALPGAAAAGRVRTRGMEDWPDALIEITLGWAEAPTTAVDMTPDRAIASLIDIHSGLATYCRASLGGRKLRDGVNLIRDLLTSGLDLLESRGVEWHEGRATMLLGSKLY